jgi:uncharacterized membrane protein YfcA
MLIKIILIVLCGILWRLGGWGKESGNPVPWKGWRVVLIPIILGAAIGLFINDHWYVRIITALASAASLNIIRIGYGNYDPEHDNEPSFLARITHDRSGWWIRAIAGALYGLVGYLPYAFYSGRWRFYLFGMVVSAAAGYCVSKLKLKDTITEPVIGLIFAGIVLVIR